MATLQQIIASIPTAQEGAVISVDYHNSILAAIKLLATQGGGTSSSAATINLAFAPQFAADPQFPWILQGGSASKPGGTATQAQGWLGLHLPDGYLVDHMVISGNKTGNVGSFSVSLLQYSLTTGSLQQTVLATTLDTATTDAAGNFSATARATSGIIVNNSQSKYIMFARIVGADAVATASLYGILIVCTQPVSTGGGLGIPSSQS